VLGVRLAVPVGLAAAAFYFSWWGTASTHLAPWLVASLLVAAVFFWSQLLSAWVLYLCARHRNGSPAIEAADALGVDVYVTACGEPLPLVERSLAAAVALEGAHSSWLLDDGDDPALAALARSLGAGYLTREGNRDRKAGNINAALPRTPGDLIVIFDVDHVPRTDFLARTIGWFADPNVGFVQAMVTFSNSGASWIARAAADTARDFYNATSLGMDRLGSATLMGSNAVIRREALASIGGYRPGLAEDLATGIALHAAGWQSRYVAEPLAPGAAPADLQGWMIQQAKWARGVFEVLVTDFPRLFRRLSWGQRLSYLVRMTYYWTGLVAATHIVATATVLLTPSGVLGIDYAGYLAHAWPLVLADLTIRRMALLAHRHESVSVDYVWRGGCLIYFTWPVYCVQWLRTLLRRPAHFRSTPKQPTPLPLAAILPQAVIAVLLIVAATQGLGSGTVESRWATGFAGLQVLPILLVLALGRARSARAAGAVPSTGHPRSARRRSGDRSNGERLLRPAYGGLIALVVLAPLPLGSHRPWAWTLLAVGIGVLLLLWVWAAARADAPAESVPRELRIPMLLFAAVCLWAGVQALPWTPGAWHHPLWAQAGEALGRDLVGRISANPEETGTALLRLLSYGGVFWLALQLCRDPRRARRALTLIAAAGAIYAAYGLGVRLSGSNRILWLEKWAYRDVVTSTFVNRNHYATYAGLTLICAGALLLQRVGALLRSPAGLRARIRGVLIHLLGPALPLTGGLLVIATALLLTESRAGVLSTLIGVIALLGSLFLARALPLRSAGALLGMLAVIGGAVFWMSGENLSRRLAATEVEELTSHSRGAVYTLVARAIRDTPLLGTGYGSFPDVFPLYRDGSVSSHGVWAQAHSTYLENALELGIPAAAALCGAVLGCALYSARGLRRRRRDPTHAAVGVAATALLGAHAAVDFSLQLPAVAVTYAFLLGTACAQSFPSGEQCAAEPRADRVLPATRPRAGRRPPSRGSRSPNG
jgi:cellulose synthase/poly-beta-1,6-N-acetylglucosamine synthase-like glycosyltransferase/O-antigen ligase